MLINLFNAQFNRLAEVGKLEIPKLQGKYETGQLFLHRVFGYRGVILFPWLARVYDRDLPNHTTTTTVSKSDKVINKIDEPSSPGLEIENSTERITAPPDDVAEQQKDTKGKTNTFYQVLIDSRDCPYIRAQTEAVTFLGNQESSRSLYAIPGLDYVAHEDILPYSSQERAPLHHELFDKFLSYQSEKDPPFEAQETLRAWQKVRIYINIPDLPKSI